MFRVVFAVLAYILILIESHPVKKDGCEALNICVTPISEILNDPLRTFAASAGDGLDAFCEILSDRVQCVEESRSACDLQGTIINADTLISGATYVCSDDGREDFNALAESECANTKWKQWEVFVEMQGCSKDFRVDTESVMPNDYSQYTDFDLAELCPFVNSWVECTVNAASDTCGATYGDFISAVLSHSVGPQFEELSCRDKLED